MGGQDTVAVTAVTIAAALVAVLALGVAVLVVRDVREDAREITQPNGVLDDCRAFVAEELAGAGAGPPDPAEVRARAVARFGATAAVDPVVDSVTGADATDEMVRGIPPAAHQACARLSVGTG